MDDKDQAILAMAKRIVEKAKKQNWTAEYVAWVFSDEMLDAYLEYAEEKFKGSTDE